LNRVCFQRSAKNLPIGINLKRISYIRLVEKTRVPCHKRLLVQPFWKIQKRHDVHIAGVPSFDDFDIFRKAAIQPLKSRIDSNGVDLSAKFKKPFKNVQSSARCPHRVDKGLEGRFIRRTIWIVAMRTWAHWRNNALKVPRRNHELCL